MRRINNYSWAEIEQRSDAYKFAIISHRDYRLMRAVVQKAEIVRATGGMACASLWEALDAFNAPEKRK